ncbi:MAG: hypothetical protein J6T12_00775 [Salinivirgaceae bacterium]|nr:hypothetical protein [Salinivirgaceae bacterium]
MFATSHPLHSHPQHTRSQEPAPSRKAGAKVEKVSFPAREQCRFFENNFNQENKVLKIKIEMQNKANERHGKSCFSYNIKTQMSCTNVKSDVFECKKSAIAYMLAMAEDYD